MRAETTPFAESGGAVGLENVPAREAAFLVEVVVRMNAASSSSNSASIVARMFCRSRSSIGSCPVSPHSSAGIVVSVIFVMA
jgi:hypothetical protein